MEFIRCKIPNSFEEEKNDKNKEQHIKHRSYIIYHMHGHVIFNYAALFIENHLFRFVINFLSSQYSLVVHGD